MTEQTAVVARRAAYQDVLDAPEHMVAEIIGGALHLHPRPRSRHARVSFALGRQVGGPFDYDPGGPGGWWILDEPELHLGPDVLVPDLAGWRRERMPVLEDVPYFEMAPDWVCEVLSPATRARDRGPKRDLYGARGVGHLWLVDPEDRQVGAFERRDTGRAHPHPGCGAGGRRRAARDRSPPRAPPAGRAGTGPARGP